jgi:hypothetical protein
MATGRWVIARAASRSINRVTVEPELRWGRGHPPVQSSLIWTGRRRDWLEFPIRLRR